MGRASAGELTMPVERSFPLADGGAAHAFAERARPVDLLLDMKGAV
jgi:hypothetical protein